jgi:hypothetical protein
MRPMEPEMRELGVALGLGRAHVGAGRCHAEFGRVHVGPLRDAPGRHAGDAAHGRQRALRGRGGELLRERGFVDAAERHQRLALHAHCARCCVRRPEASEALARASAASAGAVKPAPADRSVRREVSLRERRRIRTRAVLAAGALGEIGVGRFGRDRHARVVPLGGGAVLLLLGRVAVGAQAAEQVDLPLRLQAGLQRGERCDGRCSLLLLDEEELAPPPPKEEPETPRLADAVPSRLGSSAAPACTRVERASATRAAALATLGLAASAAAISSTSSGSSSWRHQSASDASEPPWGSGAFHCGGKGASTWPAGASGRSPRGRGSTPGGGRGWQSVGVVSWLLSRGACRGGGRRGCWAFSSAATACGAPLRPDQRQRVAREAVGPGVDARGVRSSDGRIASMKSWLT